MPTGRCPNVPVTLDLLFTPPRAGTATLPVGGPVQDVRLVRLAVASGAGPQLAGGGVDAAHQVDADALGPVVDGGDDGQVRFEVIRVGPVERVTGVFERRGRALVAGV